MRILKKVEHIFEYTLWNFRLFALIPVIFGLISALDFFVIGTVEIWFGLRQNFKLTENFTSKDIAVVVSHVIGGIDYYLIGIILLIFSFGIYELFISEIDLDGDQTRKGVLVITSLEELKKKLLQVIIVALIVSVFKKMITLQLNTSQDIIYVSVAILLISISSYLMHRQTTEFPSSSHNPISQKNIV
ncbi:MAG: YqhA family protein [Microcystaceae cyanobacterium]